MATLLVCFCISGDFFSLIVSYLWSFARRYICFTYKKNLGPNMILSPPERIFPFFFCFMQGPENIGGLLPAWDSFFTWFPRYHADLGLVPPTSLCVLSTDFLLISSDFSDLWMLDFAPRLSLGICSLFFLHLLSRCSHSVSCFKTPCMRWNSAISHHHHFYFSG